MNIMQDKRPMNEQGQPHGYWDVKWPHGGGFRLYVINGVPHGFDYTENYNGYKEIIYHAR